MGALPVLEAPLVFVPNAQALERALSWEPVLRLRPGHRDVPNDSSCSASPSVPAGPGCTTRS